MHDPVLTEPELLNKIRTDPAEFSELFRIYHAPIFGYIFRRTGDFEEAADITADTFLKAFQHIRQFTYRGIAVKVWLYRIASNEINLFYRQRKKHNAIFDKVDIFNRDLFIQFIDQDKQEMEAELKKHEQFTSILKALKSLPPKYQEVIALRYFEGKENKEIAEILDLNEGTLKSLLSRGLEKLRKKCNSLEKVNY